MRKTEAKYMEKDKGRKEGRKERTKKKRKGRERERKFNIQEHHREEDLKVTREKNVKLPTNEQ